MNRDEYLCTGRLREYSNIFLSKSTGLSLANPELGTLNPAVEPAGFDIFSVKLR
jgi:hypothetical protein